MTNLKSYKEVTVNFAINLYYDQFVVPCEAIVGKENDPRFGKTQAIPSNYTCWDKIIIDGPLTVEQLCEYLKTKYNLNIRMILAGNGKQIYYARNAKPATKSTLIEKRYEFLMDKEIEPYEDSLELRVIASVLGQAIEALVPPLKYILHANKKFH